MNKYLCNVYTPPEILRDFRKLKRFGKREDKIEASLKLSQSFFSLIKKWSSILQFHCVDCNAFIPVFVVNLILIVTTIGHTGFDLIWKINCKTWI